MDEVLLWPCLPELDQVDRAAEIVHHLPGRDGSVRGEGVFCTLCA